MSRSFLTPLNLNGLELQNANVQNLSAAPSGATAGRIYYSTALNTALVYNGTAWVPTDPSKVSAGFIPFANVAGIQSAINATPISALAAPTGNVAMAGYTLTGLATPTASGQAAEYSWVVGQIQSSAAGIASKPPVAVVSTSNITLSGVGQVIDGVTVTAGMRVLATAQTTATQNGVYIAGSSSWVAPTDDGATNELVPGAMWLVLQGTVNASTTWRVANTSTVTPGTTSVSIVQFGVNPVFTASNGVALTGNNFAAVVVASGGVLVSASGLALDTTVAVRKYATTIGDGSTTAYTVTHNLNTLDVQVKVYAAASPYADVEVDVARSSTNAITVTFASAPASGSYRVVVFG